MPTKHELKIKQLVQNADMFQRRKMNNPNEAAMYNRQIQECLNMIDTLS